MHTKERPHEELGDGAAVCKLRRQASGETNLPTHESWTATSRTLRKYISVFEAPRSVVFNTRQGGPSRLIQQWTANRLRCTYTHMHTCTHVRTRTHTPLHLQVPQAALAGRANPHSPWCLDLALPPWTGQAPVSSSLRHWSPFPEVLAP